MSAVFCDIRSIDVNLINKDEVFAIDTNVLLWTHYSKASNPSLNKHPYQVIDYPNFIAKLLANGNKLVTTVLNISELISIVEKNEFKIYKVSNSCHGMKIKDYRKILSERLTYQKEINNMLMEIKSSYNDRIEVIDITKEKLENFCNEIDKNICDVFDSMIIEYLKSISIINYISDDKDFLSIDGINLFTAYE